MATPCFSVAIKRTSQHVMRARFGVELAHQLGLIEEGCFRFCWIVDYPMFERDEESGAIGFSPQSVLHASGRAGSARKQGPLSIFSLGSKISFATASNFRAARSETTASDVMVKAFEIAGYEKIGSGDPFRCALPSFPVWRTAAWRHRAGYRSHCHVAGGTSPIFVKSSCSPSTRRRRT